MSMVPETTEQQRQHYRPPIEKCLTKDCPNPEKTRGLCGTCYATAAKAVKTGQVIQMPDGTQVQITWEWLEAQGLAKPTRKAKPKPVGLFAAQMTETMQAMGAQPIQLSPPPQPAQFTGISPPSPPIPYIPGPEAAHAASDSPPPPIAPQCPPPVEPVPQPNALVPVDPVTGQPYQHIGQPVPMQPAPQQSPAPMPAQQPPPPVSTQTASQPQLPWQQ